MKKRALSGLVLLLVLIAGLTSNAAAEDPPNCRAFDEDDDVIAEATASSAMDCSRKMQEAVRQAKCASNKGKSYRYSIAAPRTNRRTPQSVFCKSS
jgi:hypothetical protein